MKKIAFAIICLIAIPTQKLGFLSRRSLKFIRSLEIVQMKLRILLVEVSQIFLK